MPDREAAEPVTPGGVEHAGGSREGGRTMSATESATPRDFEHTGGSRKGGRAVSWLSRISSWWGQLLGKGRDHRDPEATEEFATLSSFTLLPGQLKLRVGVVSVRGNYREHNEDNYYVPGRRPGLLSEGSGVTDVLTLEPSNLFIVADGMGGQQAGEHASLMAVDLIPKAIARRLHPE